MKVALLSRVVLLAGVLVGPRAVATVADGTLPDPSSTTPAVTSPGRAAQHPGGAYGATHSQATGHAHLARASDEQTAAVAVADPSASQSGTLGEVIVTAQKYRQTAFQTPMSLAVIGGETLQRLVATNLDDLGAFVPGLSVEDSGNTLRISIRGIGDIVGQGALVGMYLNEADVTSEAVLAMNLNTYDMERIEVLRGPQGTLYGDGSVGGTIRYITNKPDLEKFQILANMQGTFVQYGAPGQQIQAVMNVPIVSDEFGLRVATDLEHDGGWVDQPQSNLKNINSKDVADVRIEGRWEPASSLTIDAMQVIHRDRGGPFTQEDANGNFTQLFNLDTTPVFEDNYNISNFLINWNLGRVNLVNSATYFTHFNNEYNWGFPLPFLPPPAQPFDEFWSNAPTEDSALSDELRLSDTGTGPWRWTVGSFFRRYTDASLPTNVYFGQPGPPGTPLPAPFQYFYDVRSKSISVFADTNLRLFHRLVVGAGVRYFKDDESALFAGDTEREVQTFKSTDPRFYIQYEVSHDLNLYTSAAKGFRSGGFNGMGIPQYQPEHVWSYELGTKVRTLDDRLQFNADIFYTDYQGYQVIGLLSISNSVGYTVNGGTARIKGLESDVTWRPIAGWMLSLSGDYIDGRFVDVSAQGASYQVGDPLDYVARYQVTGTAEREFRWKGRNGFLRLDYSQRAPESYRNRYDGPWYYSTSDHVYLLNFNSGLHVNENLQAGLFVQNLLNDRAYIGPDVLEGNSPRARPRTFGVYLSVNFE
jgi:iron complex outermembrane receptor protein